jgi:porin
VGNRPARATGVLISLERQLERDGKEPITEMIKYLSLAMLLIPMTLGAGERMDHTQSNGRDPAFGGPSGVSGEQDAIEALLDAYRRDNREIYLKSWYDWKERLKERSGFSFGINAQMLYLDASDALGEDDAAAGGIYRLQGEWVLFDRGGDYPGSIVFRVENRSKIGSGIPPASLRSEIGAVATDPGFAYSDNFGTDFSVLAWQQFFAGKRAAFAVGLLDFSAYVDAFYYQTIARGFLNRSFILSPTLAPTGIGALGGVAKGFVSDNFWIGGGFYDANAKSGDPSFDTWNSGELLKHVEVGWTPSFGRRATDRLQLTYWHKDRLAAKVTPSGSGWLLSWSWKLQDRWVPFLRAGWSDGGGGALAKRSLSGGLSYRMAFRDWLTIGAGLNKPSNNTHGADPGTEKVLEASYLWQITANISLLPDLQLIIDPANNPTEDFVWTAGLRLRAVF